MRPQIRVETELQEQVAHQIRERLIRYNAEKAGEAQDSRLVLSVRDAADSLIGGLVATGFWNNLFIELLWVAESQRRQHIGTELMAAAESHARETNRHVCVLNTFSFQAPGFYLKLGYKAFGELVGSPSGHSRIWLAKWLV